MSMSFDQRDLQLRFTPQMKGNKMYSLSKESKPAPNYKSIDSVSKGVPNFFMSQ